METFTEPKQLVDNPHYQEQRQKIMAGLSDDMIDAPILGLIKAFNKLSCCFTLQCCYGHFLYKGQRNPHNFEPLPAENSIGKVEYKIAYIAFCVENSGSGRQLLEALKQITDIDPSNIQFCCAEWFWNKQVNSYALQVEPDRFKHEDRAKLDYREALHIEKTRIAFFDQLGELMKNQHG